MVEWSHATNGKQAMMDAPRWDLVVIGAGSAGLTAARTARLLGARVLLVERDRWGGDCLWTGCVPSKTLISQARRTGPRHGENPSPYTDVRGALNRARETIAPVDSPEKLAEIGVETLHGEAKFTGPQALTVDGQQLRFARAIIATGSHPALPDVPGIGEIGALTSDTLWDLQELPERLLVLGGGAIGCELGQALARLGSQVTIIHHGPEILPHEHPEARALVRSALETDGLRIITGASPVRVQREEDGPGTAILEDGARIAFDHLLVAAGRRPSLDGLRLDAARVRVDDDGWVHCDTSLRTTNRAIWAAGDVTRLPKHTHVAGVSGAVAARNALLGTRKQMPSATSPRVLFTAPEIATVGRRPHSEDRVVTMPHKHVDRAITEDDAAGFTEIVVDRRGRIVGGTIVGPRAGETLGELALAVDRAVTVEQLTSVMHPYPTYSDGLWNAAIIETQRRTREGPTGRAADAMRRLNLWRTNRRGEPT